MIYGWSGQNVGEKETLKQISVASRVKYQHEGQSDDTASTTVDTLTPAHMCNSCSFDIQVSICTRDQISFFSWLLPRISFKKNVLQLQNCDSRLIGKDKHTFNSCSMLNGKFCVITVLVYHQYPNQKHLRCVTWYCRTIGSSSTIIKWIRKRSKQKETKKLQASDLIHFPGWSDYNHSFLTKVSVAVLIQDGKKTQVWNNGKVNAFPTAGMGKLPSICCIGERRVELLGWVRAGTATHRMSSCKGSQANLWNESQSCWTSHHHDSYKNTARSTTVKCR